MEIKKSFPQFTVLLNDLHDNNIKIYNLLYNSKITSITQLISEVKDEHSYKIL